MLDNTVLMAGNSEAVQFAGRRQESKYWNKFSVKNNNNAMISRHFEEKLPEN